MDYNEWLTSTIGRFQTAGCVPSMRELSLRKKIFSLMGNSRASLQRLTVYPNSQKDLDNELTSSSNTVVWSSTLLPTNTEVRPEVPLCIHCKTTSSP